MKKHLILSICLCSFLAVSLTNCTKTTDPQPGLPITVLSGATAPSFAESGPETEGFDNLTADFVRVSSTLSSVGSSPIIQFGHVWSSNEPYPNVRTDPSESITHTELGALTGSEIYPFRFTSYVKNLKANTSYYVRAYATTKYGTFYGTAREFKTLSQPTY